MSPAVDTTSTQAEIEETALKLASLKPVGAKNFIKKTRFGSQASWVEKLPEPARKRLEKYNIDLSKGYPKVPEEKDIPKFVDEAHAIRNEEYPYIERAKNADPERKLCLVLQRR